MKGGDMTLKRKQLSEDAISSAEGNVNEDTSKQIKSRKCLKESRDREHLPQDIVATQTILRDGTKTGSSLIALILHYTDLIVI